MTHRTMTGEELARGYAESISYAIKVLKEKQEKEANRMDDYILRDAAKAKIWKCPDAVIPTQAGEDYLIEQIDSIPAADVRPVVYGEWINKAHGIGWSSAECSICGNHVGGKTRSTGFGFEYEFPKLCDNCGADMTGDAEGGTP